MYRFDEASKTVFVGDNSGTITVLKLENTECKYVSCLKGHMGKSVYVFACLLVYNSELC